MCPDSVRNDLYNAFPFISELSDNEREIMFQLCDYSEIPAETCLMNESIQCNGITLIISGAIRIFKLSDEGKEITLYRIGRGETCVLTAACLMGNGFVPYPISAVTEQDTKMVVIHMEVFRNNFTNNMVFQRYIFSSMAAKFYDLLGLLQNITFKKTHERLMELLISKTAGGSYPLYATHELIASELGTAREVISRLLKEFERDNLVVLGRGKIVLKKIK
jgi:CRP/FNR family transcriptional regulator